MLRVVDALKYYLLKGARVPMRAHNPTVPLSAGKQTWIVAGVLGTTSKGYKDH
jgi:hypothetical protein